MFTYSTCLSCHVVTDLADPLQTLVLLQGQDLLNEVVLLEYERWFVERPMRSIHPIQHIGCVYAAIRNIYFSEGCRTHPCQRPGLQHRSFLAY
jgi:hypothetical protein